ncbi:MAG: hypothetical protein IJC64_01035 [Clostridia bacterium]|nr:hypothetical protein [Clostridia bacterium]
MKKRIALTLISVLLVACALIIPAFAANGGELCISDDYTSVTYGGKTYVKYDPLYLNLNCNCVDIRNISYTEEQNNDILYCSAYDYGAFIMLDLSFAKGGDTIIYYLDTAYVGALEEFLENGGRSYISNDYIFGYQTLDTTAAKLMSTPILMKGYWVAQYEFYLGVTNTSDDGFFEKTSGYIFTDGDDYYYLDYYQFGADGAEVFDAMDHGTVTVYKITDKDILSQLGGDSDIIIDGGGYEPLPMQIISTVLLVLLLGIAPLAAAIVCLIFSFKAKHPYNKFLRAIAIALAVAVIAFIVCAIIVFAV